MGKKYNGSEFWLIYFISSSSLSFSSIYEHTASLGDFQRTRLLATAFTSFHVFPILIISSWTVRRQVPRGRPLCLVPCGFHSRALLSIESEFFLKVWPIQRHFLLLICTSTGSSPALSHKTWLLTVSGQCILNILRKQRLMNVCSFRFTSLLNSQVSDPYNNIDLTLLLKILSLVVLDILLFF